MDDAAADGDIVLLDALHQSSFHTSARLCTAQAMDRAAANDDIVGLEWLHQHRREGCSMAAFEAAAKRGSVVILEWLFEFQCVPDRQHALESSVMFHAVQSGQTRVVQWLCFTRPAFVPFFNAFDLACECGHLEVAQCLDALSSTRPALAPHSSRAMDIAADQGHIAVVQWLHLHRAAECTTDAIDFACAQGHLDVARWLLTHRREGCTARALIDAAANGHVAIVEWLLRHRVVALDDAVVTQAKRLAMRRKHTSIVALLNECSVASALCVATQWNGAFDDEKAEQMCA
ncbi:hypothetical protein PINS_up005985 [Pythium insidiosum]|nr:hypothetical protein PINS_up005985 [Pythium insidiosum]